MFPKPVIAAGLLVSLIWLFMVCLLAERFNIPSGDGILYSLPFSATNNPFQLGIPFLENFDGYGSTWGHNWPGSMWVKALFFSVIPYSRLADVAVLSLFQLLAAWVAAAVVWKGGSKIWPAAAAFIIMLSDRLLMLSCAGNRIESIAVAVVLLLFALAGRTGRTGWLLAAIAFICPTLHPYSLVTGGTIVAWHFLAVRNTAGSLRWSATLPLFCFFLGSLATAAWFFIQPEALIQFAANLTLQKSFYQSWNSVIPALGNYRLSAGLALWGAATMLSVMWFAGGPPPVRRYEKRFLAPVLFLLVGLLHTVTRCENFHYLAFGSPLAVIMLCITSAWLWDRQHRGLRLLSASALAGLTALHALLLPVRLLQFQRAGMPDLAETFASVLEALPAGHSVFIPHPMWSAAITDKSHQIRWFTFPIASPKATRKRYEQTAYSKAKPGDFLIIENGGAGQQDRFGLYPTFATNPPDPNLWRHVKDYKQLFQGSIVWGIDLSIYEYRDATP